jgi:polyhydroxybutyrate depolymerase
MMQPTATDPRQNNSRIMRAHNAASIPCPRRWQIGRYLRSVGAVALTCLVASGGLGAQAGRQTEQARAEQTTFHGGRQRSYLVHDFSREPQAPAVIVLHGGGGNAENAVQMTGMDRIAMREGLIVVYPNGTAGRERGRLLTWNAGHCCAAAMAGNVDDAGFVAAVIDTLVASGRVDASRVYVTGMSNGAMLAHRLGRELSTKIAAIAPVVGAVFGDEGPSAAPVPAFIIVGADDEIVPGAGGPLRVRASLGGGSAADHDVAPAVDQAAYWARTNGCTEPMRTQGKASSIIEWRTCTSGAPVIFHSVAGNGHAWPGGEPGRAGAAQPTRAFNASEEMWAFFKTQRRAPEPRPGR